MCYWKALLQVHAGRSDVSGNMTVRGPCKNMCLPNPCPAGVEAEETNV